MKTIGIIGAERAVGQSVAKAFLRAGYHVRAYVPYDTPAAALAPLEHARFDFVRGHADDVRSMRALFEACDLAFVHCAFQSHYEARHAVQRAYEIQAKLTVTPHERALLCAQQAAQQMLHDGRAAIDACKLAEIGHLYLCTAESPLHATNGEAQGYEWHEHLAALQTYAEAHVGALTCLRLALLLETLVEVQLHSVEDMMHPCMLYNGGSAALPVLGALHVGDMVRVHWRKLCKGKLSADQQMQFPLESYSLTGEALAHALSRAKALQAAPLALEYSENDEEALVVLGPVVGPMLALQRKHDKAMRARTALGRGVTERALRLDVGAPDDYFASLFPQ